MSIPIPPEKQRGNDSSKKNALLIRVKAKLPTSIKAKLKRLGTVWLEAYQGYAIPIEQKGPLDNLLSPWKAHVRISDIQIDPKSFTPAGRAQNGKDLKISILQEQIHRESMQLMCDIR